MAIFGFGKHDHNGEHEKDHLRNVLVVGFALFFLSVFAYAVSTHQIVFAGEIRAQDVWTVFTYVLTGLLGYVMGRNNHSTEKKADTDKPAG